MVLLILSIASNATMDPRTATLSPMPAVQTANVLLVVMASPTLANNAMTTIPLTMTGVHAAERTAETELWIWARNVMMVLPMTTPTLIDAEHPVSSTSVVTVSLTTMKNVTTSQETLLTAPPSAHSHFVVTVLSKPISVNNATQETITPILPLMDVLQFVLLTDAVRSPLLQWLI
jgi:hypothetical protein